VEGAEIEALEGALGLIERSRPTLLVEVHWTGDRLARLVNEQLAPLGYTIATLAGGAPPTAPARFHAVLTPT
jgi:hypothetical protein